MKEFCIPVALADKFKKAAQAGEIDIQDLYEKTSDERRAIFSKYTDKNTAQLINTGFEEAMVSAQKESLMNWAKKTFVGDAKKTKVYKDVIDKINELDSLGVINPNNSDQFLEDLAATKLGISITKDEVKTLSKFATDLQELKPISDESEFGISMDYLKKRRELNNYIESLTPSSNLKVATSVIGRGAMLAALKSPILNIESNAVAGALEAFTKRLAKGRFAGFNGELSRKYIKFATKVYKETGFDITRMMEVQLSPKVLGEDTVSSQGSGLVRKVGRVIEDVIFKRALGTPDVRFSAISFADTANLTSAAIAKSNGLKGTAAKSFSEALMKDAMRLIPQTDAGRKLRDQSIADASYATYQNDSWVAKMALDIRSILNNASGDLRLGDQLMPFVKTPANVIAFGLDYSGGGVLKGAKEMKKAFDAKREGNEEDFKKHFENARRNWIRAGLGLTLAFVIASLFKKDEFIGAYPTDPKEKELFRTENGVANSVLIGDKYVSLEYFGGISAPLMGFLYAKKFGKDIVGQASQYLYGELNEFSKFPGYTEVSNLLTGISDRAAQSENYTVQQEGNDIINGITDFISSRVIPGAINDLAIATDKFQRQVDYNSPIAKLMAKIPGWRETLPIKTDQFGNQLLTEDALSTTLFGAKVKTENTTPVVEELQRLKSVDALPSLTDPRSSSQRFIALGTQLSTEKYGEAYAYYQAQLAKQWSAEIGKKSYISMQDDKKQDELNNIKSNILDQTLNKFGYKKPPKK